MKNQPKARAGIALVFLSFLLAIMAISAIESVLFYEKFRNVETLESLHNSVNHISAVVSRLGNTLDIVVVGQRFEQITINILRNDVKRIDGEINAMVGKYNNDRFIRGNKILAEELRGVPGEWRKIYIDMMKYRADMSADEVMLIHNDIDVDVLVLDEKLDRVSTGIDTLLKNVFSEIKMLLITALGAFVLLLGAASVFLYVRFISPIYKLERKALAMSSGKGGKRFTGQLAGIAGSVSEALNTILEGAERKASELGEQIDALNARVRERERAIRTLSDFYSEAGKTFDIETLFRNSLQKVPTLTGAFGALVYLRDGERLALKASAWAGKALADIPPAIEGEALDDGSGMVMDLGAPRTPRALASLRSDEVRWLISLAIGTPGENDFGRLLLLYTLRPEDEAGVFTTAVVSAMDTAMTFVRRLREEYDSKERYLALLNQLPMGIAVFGKEGICILANLVLKKFLGAGPDFDFVGNYTFREDNILEAQGLVTTVSKAYDGFVTEFIINYDPYLVSRYGFMGDARDLRVRSVPLYEPDGTISKIALIYEDITLVDESGGEVARGHS